MAFAKAVWRIKVWIDTHKDTPFAKECFFGGKDFNEAWAKALKIWPGAEIDLLFAERLGELK